MAAKILIAEDDADIQEILKLYLENAGFTVIRADDGTAAFEKITQDWPDLVLVDIMMPGMNGFELTKRIRSCSNIPIIIISAMNADSDKILGLDIGADDYVTKPFNPLEVLARVKAQLRRYTRLGGLATRENVLRANGIEMDDESKTVTLNGEPVTLTPTEYEILKLLMLHPNRVYSTGELYREVWHDAPMGAEGTIAVHIRHLREKLEINPSEPRYLKVVWGQGYKLEV